MKKKRHTPEQIIKKLRTAAKMHLRLDLHSFLPSFAIVETAAHHDNKRAREVCADFAEGDSPVRFLWPPVVERHGSGA